MTEDRWLELLAHAVYSGHDPHFPENECPLCAKIRKVLDA